jgi:hypothetical protein
MEGGGHTIWTFMAGYLSGTFYWLRGRIEAVGGFTEFRWPASLSSARRPVTGHTDERL